MMTTNITLNSSNKSETPSVPPKKTPLEVDVMITLFVLAALFAISSVLCHFIHLGDAAFWTCSGGAITCTLAGMVAAAAVLIIKIKNELESVISSGKNGNPPSQPPKNENPPPQAPRIEPTGSKRNENKPKPIDQPKEPDELSKEALLDKFWKYEESDEFKFFLEVLSVSGCNSTEIVHNLVLHFQSNQHIKLNDEAKKSIIEILTKQMSVEKRKSNQILISENGSIFHVHDTKGDGSCGIHALIGACNNENQYEYKDIEKIRENFCNDIKRKAAKDEIPYEITTILDDYFLHWDYAPSALKKTKENIEKRNELMAEYIDIMRKIDEVKEEIKKSQTEIDNSKSEIDKAKAEQDKDKAEAEKFRLESDIEVVKKTFRSFILDDYLKNLKKVGTNLLQDELIAFAKFERKTIILYQPGWGKEDAENITEQICNEGESEPIHIWYNGRSHYERATLVHLD